ncbi:MAG: hypothetical protein U9N78_08290 [Actinomycetota bacterium]|nr:hypothetical protein [Actinomycetota bacterium]
MSSILWFHQNWVYVALATNGLVGVWGLVLAALRRRPGRAFGIGVGAAIFAILIQVAAGTVLYVDGLRPLNGFHVFYGVVVAVTLSLAYVYRAQLARNPALAYGLLLLFVMGLGFRAWANIS